MVHLMLDAHGQQAVGLDLERLAVDVEGADLDPGRALDAVIDAGHRQAAFVVDLLFFAGPGDFRVDENHQLFLGFGHVDGDHALVHVHLGRGQADARRVVHGIRHVGHQLAQALGTEFGNRLGNLVQARVGIAEDVEKGHIGSNFGGVV